MLILETSYCGKINKYGTTDVDTITLRYRPEEKDIYEILVLSQLSDWFGTLKDTVKDDIRAGFFGEIDSLEDREERCNILRFGKGSLSNGLLHTLKRAALLVTVEATEKFPDAEYF